MQENIYKSTTIIQKNDTNIDHDIQHFYSKNYIFYHVYTNERN